MLVVVQGDPLQLASTVVGLDILGPRHPKLHSLLVARLGFQTAPDSQVGQGGYGCPLGNVSGITVGCTGGTINRPGVAGAVLQTASSLIN